MAFVAIGLAIGASAWLLRSRISARQAPEPATAALGAVAALAGVALWIANPYLALLCAPATHVWLLNSSGRTSGPLPVTAGVLAAIVLPVAAALAVAPRSTSEPSPRGR